MRGKTDPRWRSRCVAIAAAACAALAASAAEAGALAPLTATRVTPPADAHPSSPEVSLAAVSCGAVGDCVAAGRYDNGDQDMRPLLVRRSGGTWTPAGAVPLPADAGTNGRGEIHDVACPAAGECTAVGHYDDAAGRQQALLLTLSGGVWTPATAAMPNNADDDPNAEIVAVSCTAPGECVAVGTYRASWGQLQAVILTQTGGGWGKSLTSPVPPDASTGVPAPRSELLAVSCTADGSCTAVGGYVRPSSTYPLIVTRAGGVWTPATLPLPGDAHATLPLALLRHVACVSATDCVTTGTYHSKPAQPDNYHGLVSIRRNTSWGTVRKLLPPTGSNQQRGPDDAPVACPQALLCTIAGRHIENSGFSRLTVLDQAADDWAAAVPALPPPDAIDHAWYPDLGDVACWSARNCLVAGRYATGPGPTQQHGMLIPQTDGVWGAGVRTPLPPDPGGKDPGGAVVLSSVVCAAAQECTAAGHYRDAGNARQGLLIDVGSGMAPPAPPGPPPLPPGISPPGAVPPPATPNGRPKPARTKLKVRRGTVTITLICGRRAPCTGAATLRAGRTKIGSVRYRIKAGARKNIRFKLSRKLRIRLTKAKGRRLKTVLTIKPTGGRSAKRTITLRR